MLLVLMALLFASAGPANGRQVPSLVLSAYVAAPGEEVVARISGLGPLKTLRLYLLPLLPLPGTAAHQVGAVVSDTRGRAALRFSLPSVPADVYYLVARRSRSGSSVLRSHVISVRAEPPTGFGRLGAAACAPPSPRNTQASGTLAATEVFGTASGTELWALGATEPVGDAAVLNGVVGKEKKIIFRMTSGVPSSFYAVGPDGARVLPVWGPTPHGGSDWNRPGHEWGAGFVFGVTGCWRIHAGTPPAQGDLWLNISS
jgi:hypothetical protein